MVMTEQGHVIWLVQPQKNTKTNLTTSASHAILTVRLAVVRWKLIVLLVVVLDT